MKKTEFIIWRKDIEIGIEKVDNQHKKLITLINELYNSYIKKTHKDKVIETISSLKEYSIYHFNTEEKIFDEKKYPHKAEHVAEHEKFITKISEFCEKYEKQEGVLTLRLLMYLQKWVLDHIKKEDKKYAQFLKENQ